MATDKPDVFVAANFSQKATLAMAPGSSHLAVLLAHARLAAAPDSAHEVLHLVFSASSM